MDFDFTPDQKEIRGDVAAFARAELNAGLLEDDQAGRFSRDKWQKAARFGLHGLPMPERYGGTDRDLLTTVCAMEGLGYGCRDNGLIFSINAHIWSAEIPLLRFGSDEQKERYLHRLVSGEWIAVHAMTEEGSGSDAFNVQTTAARDGGTSNVLNGAKVFITNGPVADLVIVFATVDRNDKTGGLTAFLVEKGRPVSTPAAGSRRWACERRRWGRCFSTTAGCRSPTGWATKGPAWRSSTRPWTTSARAFSPPVSARWSINSRRAWRGRGPGSALASRSASSSRCRIAIADMAVRLETARLLLYKVAWLLAQGRRATAMCAMAKLYVSECLVESSMAAIQLFGGYGYTADLGIERDLRDAVGGTI